MLFAIALLKTIDFSHRDFPCWVKALNVYLVRVIYDSVEDSISQRAVCTSELIVPVGLMILGTEDG